MCPWFMKESLGLTDQSCLFFLPVLVEVNYGFRVVVPESRHLVAQASRPLAGPV